MGYINKQSYYEKECSTKVLMNKAKKALQVESLSGEQYFDLLRQGEYKAKEIFNIWLGKLARGIADVIMVLDPEKVIIGGAISKQKELLFEPLNQKIKQLLPDEFEMQTEIILAECGNDAGMLGAVSQFVVQN